jgi:Protein of unknown function (DUF3048) N-terminal domain/Protein of unknown function (DUF3048) C-terminal domain
VTRTNRSVGRRGAGAVIAALLVSATLVACSGGGDGKAAAQKKPTTTTTVPPSTTTTTPPPPKAPLTGLEDPSGQAITRPAVSVKVENTPGARPQGGLDQADVVYEEVVEGNITRLVAMFNSQVPDVIGPVRSVRAIDPDIVWPLGGIFAFSGGAPINVEAAQAAPVTLVTENNQDVLIRNAPGQPPRGAPHNLYALGGPLFAAGGQPVPSPALFQYYLKGAGLGTDPGVISMRVGFQAGYDPTWVWDAPSWSWKRFNQGEPHTAVSGNQIGATNVVVQFTEYPGEGDGITVGEGDVWIFTDGQVRTGRWVRPDRAQPARYVDGAGAPLLLRPGPTWVELLPTGSPVDIEFAPPPTTTTAPPTTLPPTTTTAKKGKKSGS